ncbi:MAG TPA: hypothetical protein VLY46_13215 [Usitatibacter sp.]|nr:hypothetical protein [Usitatibacter sp.]
MIPKAMAGATGADEAREPILDSVERVSEMCFGLFMALTFVGAVSAARPGEDAAGTMLHAALGCNLAWGLVDAVMYLVRTITDRGERHALAFAVRDAPDAASAIRILRDAFPPRMRELLGNAELESMRARLAAMELPDRVRFHRHDLAGAVGIFVIVVLTTFPVALPFVLLSDVPTALLISRLLTFAMLFGGGVALARHADYPAWKGGLMLLGLGVALTAAIIALGG